MRCGFAPVLWMCFMRSFAGMVMCTQLSIAVPSAFTE